MAVWIPSEPGDLAEHSVVDLKAGTVTFACLAGRAAGLGLGCRRLGGGLGAGAGRAAEPVGGAALVPVRHCDGAASQWPASDQRIRLLAAMLGIAAWTGGSAAQPAGAAGASGNGHVAARG